MVRLAAVLACLSLLALQPATALAAGKRYALLVGVEKYRHAKLDDLKYCGDDVLALEKILTPQGYRCLVLRNESDAKASQPPAAIAPTAANIEAGLKSMLSVAGKEDLVLVVLSGHGLQPLGASQPYFCPQDANPGFKADANGVQSLNAPETLVGIGTVLKQLDQSGAGEKLVLVDACRNAPALKGMKGGVNDVNFQLLPAQCGVLLSCSRGEFSFESGTLGRSGRGVFLHHVIEGLQGAAKDPTGHVTWASLVAHVNLSVQPTIEKLFAGAGARQTPHQIANLVGSPRLATLPKQAVPLPTSIRVADRNAAAFVGKTAGEEWSANGLKMKFRWCPDGSFLMGGPAAQPDRRSDEAPVDVSLTGFWMGQFEVTQSEWKSVMETGLEEHAKNGILTTALRGKGPNFPMYYVGHEEASDFARRYTEREREAGRLPAGWEYRLPTEAQWEYACRAGTTTTFFTGEGAKNLSASAWFEENSQGTTHEVGTRKPNAWGLCDMQGNVSEWCRDWYSEKRIGGRDPEMTRSGSGRVFRGGSWNFGSDSCRSATRNSGSGLRVHFLGFRLALVRLKA